VPDKDALAGARVQTCVCPLWLRRLSELQPSSACHCFRRLDELNGLGDGDSIEFKDPKGNIRRNDWIDKVTLNGNSKTDYVSFFQFKYLIV